MFDAVPPGVDELVALAKVVALARADSYGVHFDRVIVDTAPTGHTLRLLTYPESAGERHHARWEHRPKHSEQQGPSSTPEH